MQIKKIIIENFRAIERMELDDMQHALLLCGNNGQGKSSVIYAVQYLLFGWCPMTAKNGNGYRELIADGQKQAEISAVLCAGKQNTEVSVVISRTGSPEFSAVDLDTGEILDSITNRDELWRHLGVDKRYAMAAAMPDAYIANPDTKDLADMLSDLLVQSIDPDEITALLETDSARDWWRDYAAEHKPRTIADLKDCGEVAYKKRRDTNAALKDREIDLENAKAGLNLPVKDTRGKTLTVADAERIQRGVAKLRETAEDLAVELGRASTAMTPSEAAGIRAELEQVEAEHKRETEQNDAIQIEIARLADALRDAETEVQTAKLAGNAALKKRDEAQARLAALHGHGGVCQTCKRPYTDDDIARLVGPAMDAAKLADEYLRECSTATQAALAKLNPIRSEMREQAEIAEKHGRIVGDLHDRIILLRGRLGQQTHGRPEADIQAELDATKTRITQGEEILENLRRLAEYESARTGVEMLRKKSQTLSEIVVAFRDGGITNRLTGGGVDDFISRVNSELRFFGDYAASIEIDGKRVTLLLACPGQPPRPVWLCNKAARQIARYAVAMAFADLGGVVILDDIDGLDNAHRDAMFGRLSGVESGTVIVSGAVPAAEYGLVCVDMIKREVAA